MHITSLPSKYGIGVMGEETKRFIRRIKDMGFSYWQVLPLCPTDFYGSPYASPAAFALSPLLIDPDTLKNDGYVSEDDLARSVYYGSPYTADYEFAAKSRRELLKIAYQNKKNEVSAETEKFCEENPWCEAYSLFCAAKEKFGGKPWYEWDEKFARYENALKNRDELKDEADFYKFEQYIAFSQWHRIKQFANENGVKILGDMPIYVSTDSADVWSNTELFEIDERSFVRRRVSGVPPDYFSKDGQLWGNPLYNWDVLEKTGYAWWLSRIKDTFRLYDTVRIDHFRAFASYWAVPADEKTAKNGEWVKGPGMKFFDAVKEEMGDVPIIAEDLGVFGEDVTQLLDKTRFPGMRVIQFGFDPCGNSTHLPHNYPLNTVAYVGTHDNTTLLAWLWEATPEERAFALDYCGFTGDNWGDGGYYSPSCRKIIETVWRSSAKLAVISYQDMCGFGSDARMNVPGRAFGNWQFRTTEETIDGIDKNYFRHINDLFRRTGGE